MAGTLDAHFYRGDLQVACPRGLNEFLQVPFIGQTGTPPRAPLWRTHLVQMPRNNAYMLLRKTTAAVLVVLPMQPASSWCPVVRDLLPHQQAQLLRAFEWRSLGT